MITKGAQCRTMASQRPCGMHVCTRPECQGSKPGTKNDVTGSQSVPQTEGDIEPTYDLKGLTDRDLSVLLWGLNALWHRAGTDTMRARITEMQDKIMQAMW